MARSVLFALLLLTGCLRPEENIVLKRSAFTIHDPYFDGEARMTMTSKGFRIALLNNQGEQLDQTIFNYRAYQLDTADVNRDGRTEILVGLIKPTEFDPQEKKRLFILRIDEGQLRPLWLGSKVCQQLVDFKALPHGFVRTLEKTKHGNFAVGVYEWQGFGLTLIQYLLNEKPYPEVVNAFNR
jgi:hypothetical protein